MVYFNKRKKDEELYHEQGGWEYMQRAYNKITYWFTIYVAQRLPPAAKTRRSTSNITSIYLTH